jgi:hypothetical protein
LAQQQVLITGIDIYRFSIKMEPFTIATGTMDSAQNTFIRVHTDGGILWRGRMLSLPDDSGRNAGHLPGYGPRICPPCGKGKMRLNITGTYATATQFYCWKYHH